MVLKKEHLLTIKQNAITIEVPNFGYVLGMKIVTNVDSLLQ